MEENDFKNIKKIGISFLKKISMPFLIICILIVFLGASFYNLNIEDGSYKKGEKSNTPYAVDQHLSNTIIDSNGNITTGMSAQELWDQMLKDGSRVDAYLDGPEELQKLMNAEIITDYLDTRENPDDPIDWNTINADVNSTATQGIIKLKRRNENGETSTLKYVDSETFQTYIDNYKASGSEQDKQIALSHFTLEKEYATSNASNVGIIYGSGTFNKYNLTDDQLKGMANLCKQEQGTLKGAAAEASLMANLFELKGSAYGTGADGLYNYVRNSGWFANAADYMDNGDADSNYVDVVKAVLVNGKRTLPGYIDEHDCFSDITVASNNGTTIPNKEERTKYVQHITKISNVYGSNYTFYSFPDTNSDPFGYTSEENRKNIGDFYYDFETGNETNKKGTPSDTDTDTVEYEELNWPTNGTQITSYFGPRNSPTSGASTDHKGIDIAVAEGTDVYAIEAGTVVTAGTSDSAGEWIAIDHGNGYISKYMHNSELKVAAGDKVEKGALIALSGNTGISTGSHLHFQIELNGTPVDPLSFKYNNGKGNGQGGIGSDINSSSMTNTFYAKVATWNEVTEIITSTDPSVQTTDADGDTTYNMTSTKINYQELVSGYKMPFDYLWALLVVSQDKEFAFELADLVYDSEIEITVHDNLSINTNMAKDSYTIKTKVDTAVQVKVTYDQLVNPNVVTPPFAKPAPIESKTEYRDKSFETETEKSYETTHTVKTKTNTINTALTKANVWIVNYAQGFTQKNEDPVISASNIQYEDEEYGQPYKTDHEDSMGLAENFRREVFYEISAKSNVVRGSVSAKVEKIENQYYSKKVSRTVTIGNRLETSKYISSPATIEEKTDKNSTEANFVTIFIEYGKARSNIISARLWLFEILESSPEAKDMIDLTKYLMYKATESDYGVTEFDFAIFDPKNFKSLGDQYGGVSNIEGVPGQIYDFLLAKGVPPVGAAAVVGNIEGESTFNPAAVNELGCSGLCQWKGGRLEKLKTLANNRGVQWTDVDIQLEYMWNELENSYTSVKNVIMDSTEESQMEYAIWYWGRYFEVYFLGDNFEETKHNSEERYGFAQKWYKEWKEKHTGSTSGTYGTVYYQQDYAHVPYGSSNISDCGCGPTCFAMVASDYTGRQITPEDAVKWCGNDYYVSGQGTSWTYFAAATKHFQLPATCKDLGNDINAAVSELQKGNLVISSQVRGLFTNGGHFILLSSVDSSGGIRVRDPNKNNAVNKGYNDRVFTANEISSAGRNYWAFQK